MKYSFSLIYLFFLVVSCTPKVQPVVLEQPTPPVLPTPLPAQAKNVIFLIGDGMGLPQVQAAMVKSRKQLHIQRFRNIGFHENASADDLITDSAAGATAFSIGRKTNNGYIGMDENNVAHKTIMEEANENGMVTGLVATSTIVHATPASFVAHVKSRKEYEEIAKQMASSETDIMIGGGLKYFNLREDERDLLKEMEGKGYSCKSFLDEDMSVVEFPTNQKHIYLTANDSPIPVSQGRDYLVDASRKALEYVSQKEDEGFMIMIEGSQIDWGGHANNFDYVVSELLEYDEVIGMALDFAEKDGETLVVLTADHETGGLTILKGSSQEKVVSNFASDYHTSTLIPVYAYGPGSENFQGFYSNKDIYGKLRKSMAKITD